MRSGGHFQFTTKATTLAFLAENLSSAVVCESIVFSAGGWRTDQRRIISDIQSNERFGEIIVRSSALNEDGFNSSMAGAYTSVLNVDSSSTANLIDAIESVITSYGPSAEAENEVLIQPMITNVSMSGVIFSHDLNSGSPYYVINYDDQSGLTDTITSGTTDTERTLLVYREKVDHIKSARFKALLLAVQEVESLTPAAGLDIEFAVTKNEEIYIFQVRPMAVAKKWEPDIAREVSMSLGEIETFVRSRFCEMPNVLGKQSIFGEMPDWNPAEMIGVVPRDLARTTYEYLITNSAWAQARAELGYRDLSHRPLMVNLGGRVFIDVRESFNSFLPAELGTGTATKIVNFWLDKLHSAPELHDKIEFEVATTSLSLNFEMEAKSLASVLSAKELESFKAHLLNLTQNIVAGGVGDTDTQFRKLAALDDNRRSILAENSRDKLYSVRELLCDCITNGTVPFAIMARKGFIAENFLRSIEELGLLTKSRVSEFRNSVPTVLSDFLKKMASCNQDGSGWESFLDAYGHLRPGTYDILAKRYDQQISLSDVAKPLNIEKEVAHSDFQLTTEEKNEIDDALAREGFRFKATALFDFFAESISGREKAKLIFTKNISDALELIAGWGSDNGLSREELSYLPIAEILATTRETCPEPRRGFFQNLSMKAQHRHVISKSLQLPYLISNLSDIYVVPMLKSRPNFVTKKRVQGAVVELKELAFDDANLDGNIVAIEGADPGYDWIFSNKIIGLITKYGGANSHMAIRCAELGIPAAIGCGEQIFEQVKKAKTLLLDCNTNKVSAIN